MPFWPFRRKEFGPPTAEQFVGSLISATGTAGPEKRFCVTVSDGMIQCTKHDGTVETIALSALGQVELIGTDWGPFLPDQFWVLQGTEGQRIVVPLGASGREVLLEHLQTMPGFRHDLFGEAMSLTSNIRFVVWQSNDLPGPAGP